MSVKINLSLNDIEKIMNYFNKKLFHRHYILIKEEVSERTITGMMMYELNHYIHKNYSKKYYADIEYNKVIIKNSIKDKNFYNKNINVVIDNKTINNPFDYSKKIIKFNPDIIIHLRGEKDNLVLIEVKKRRAAIKEKNKDLYKMALVKKDTNYEYKYYLYFEYDDKEKKEENSRLYYLINDNDNFTYDKIELNFSDKNS